MPHTILAVDDSATMRKVLEITFDGPDFKLVTADSPSAALEKLKSERPSLVIADVSLPPGDGYDLCSTIKLAQPQLPVLMLSSKHHPFDPAKGGKADDHIDKPFDTQLMTDKVRKMLEGGAAVAAVAPALQPVRSTTDSPPAFAKASPAPAAPVAPAAPAGPAAGPLGTIRKIGPTGDTQRPASPATPRVGGATPGPTGVVARQPPPVVTPARRTMAFGSPQVPTDLATTRPGTGPLIRPSPPVHAKAEPPAPSIDAPPVTSPLGTPGATKRRVGADTLPGVKVAEEHKPVAPVVAQAPRLVTPPAEPTPPPPAAAPVAAAPSPTAAAVVAAAVPALDAELTAKVRALGLTAEQVQAVAALSRELIERVVWEVVPPLAEVLIKEEIARLTKG